MKIMLLLLTFTTIINPMHNQNLRSPRPLRANQLYAQRHMSQLPMELIIRPDTPRPELDDAATPPRQTSAPARMADWSIQMSPMTPQEQVHIEEVRANAIVIEYMSKKKIACLVAASAITSAVLTATVTLTIHFTECDK